MDTHDALYCAAAAAGVVAAAASSALWLGAAAVLLATAYALQARAPLLATRAVPQTGEVVEESPSPRDLRALVRSQKHTLAAAQAAPQAEQLRGPGGEVQLVCGVDTWDL